jgi:outer membrane protein TolC
MTSLHFRFPPALRGALGLLVLLLLGVRASSAHGQPQIDLPAIDDAAPQDAEALVDALLAGNPDIARLQWSVAQARSALAATAAVMEYNLGVRAGVLRAEQPTNDGLSSGIARQDRYDTGITLSRMFAPGTRLQFGLDQAVTRSRFPFASPLGTQEIVRGPNVETGLSVNISQPLLRGFGRDVTLLSAVLARRQLDVAEQRVMQEAAGRIFELLTALLDLDSALEDLDVRHRSLDRARVQLDIAAAELQAGRIAPVDLDLLRQRVAVGQEAVLIAWAQAQTQTRNVRRLLQQNPRPREVIRAPLPEPDLPSMDPDRLCQQAQDHAPDLLAARAQLVAARTDLRRTRDGLRPELEVSGSLAQRGLDAGWAGSVGQVARLEATVFQAGVTFNMPLGNAAARDAWEQSRIQVSQAEFEVDAIGRALCQQVHEVLAQRELLEERAALASWRADVARRGLQAEEARLAQGLGAIQQTITALDNLEEVEAEVLRLQQEERSLRWRLAHLTGEVTRRWLFGRANLDTLLGQGS